MPSSSEEDEERITEAEAEGLVGKGGKGQNVTQEPRKGLTNTNKPPARKAALKKCKTVFITSEEEEEDQYHSDGIDEVVEVDVGSKERSCHPVKTQEELDKEDLGE
jgi:hypothetical protein